ncbi:MAG: AMP-binding protein [Myxococcales bacterium]|nr:AMP-binding protein [Myxococcales bacterium]
MSFVPPAELARRNPLITERGFTLLQRLLQHPDAPSWNHTAGDRLDAAGLTALDAFRGRLRDPAPFDHVAWVQGRRDHVEAFRKRLPEGTDVARDWVHIPTMSREDLAVHVEEVIPDDADLDALIVYKTAGTTGHPLVVPHSVVGAASYLAFVEAGLARHGLVADFAPDEVACFLVGNQVRTVTYPTVLSGWNQAGFAKLNLHADQWPTPESAHRYFEAHPPRLLTGDPISFAELMRRDVPVKPMAMITTAVGLTDGLRASLASHFDCPVIDWYSLTETGPIAAATPEGVFEVLAPDLYVEAIDESGRPVADGERGEITVTGGRNPFVPLLRYRTGDWGRLHRTAQGHVQILDLEGRAPVMLRSAAGGLVNPVDVSRVLRPFPLVQHELVQRADGSCDLAVRTLTEDVSLQPVRDALKALLGAVEVRVQRDPTLGDRKVIPYHSELLEE